MSAVKEALFCVEYCYICSQYTLHREDECQNHCEHEMPEDWKL